MRVRFDRLISFGPPLARAAYIATVLLACGGSEEDDAVLPSGPPQSGPAAQLEPADSLLETASFGWSSLAEAQRELSPGEVEAGGAMLSNLVDLVEAPNGDVFAFDRRFLKLVMFAPDGSVRRIVPYRAGEGPGEFRRPTNLAVDVSGHAFIFDPGLSRISEFDTTGTLVRSIPSPPGYGLMSRDGNLLLLRRPRAQQRAVLILSRAGELLDSVVNSSERDAELAASGEPGAIGVARDGAILYGSPSATQWVEVSNGVERRFGSELQPDARGQVTAANAHFSPIGARAIAKIAPGLVAIVVTEFEDTEQTNALRLKWSLHVLNGEGTLLRAYSLDERAIALGRAFLSAHAPNVYLFDTDPFPRVWRFRWAR